MKPIPYLINAVVLSLATGSASAQFVKGNEAITVMPDGTKKVETPPLPSATLRSPCPAERASCTPSGWRMVETDRGLQECTEIYARAGTCRASTFGAEKRPRLWIVKLKGAWMQCQHPNIASKCVSTKTLPHAVIQ
ncbi:MAG: hypothetical protein ACT6S0_03935 [Roseateles sp.]|uniref:hypothetical protein n=1 Tax=Roseateles sp. TaxID=1971397 RepID=UPI0040354504